MKSDVTKKMKLGWKDKKKFISAHVARKETFLSLDDIQKTMFGGDYIHFLLLRVAAGAREKKLCRVTQKING
jgi:hypothetical protein